MTAASVYREALRWVRSAQWVSAREALWRALEAARGSADPADWVVGRAAERLLRGGRR